jgi:hypothetical protein
LSGSDRIAFHHNLTVLVLGAEYGVRQQSGYSATEEEFREARESRRLSDRRHGLSLKAKTVSLQRGWTKIHRMQPGWRVIFGG